ncbi:MAG: hypothetical protein RI957_977 [Verrucomicrobiota bacterium]|jgi:autotransporter-associated beta strand protein
MKSKKQNPFLSVAITVASLACVTSSAFAASPYTWTPLAAGPFNWNNASSQNNWGQGSASFPNAPDDVANMNVNLSANQTVNLNQVITVGSLTIGDNSGAQTETLAPNGGSLSFDVGSGSANLIRTATGTGATTISAPIVLNDNLLVSLASGTAASTMTLSGIISEAGGSKTLTKEGSTLTLVLQGANTFSGGVTILSGTVDSKTTQTTLGTGTLVIGGPGGVNPVFQTGVNNANAVQVNANTTGTSIIAANGTGSGFVMSGAITLNGNLNVRTFSAGTTASVTLSGGVTGSGNLLMNNLNNGTGATGKITLSGTVNNTGTVTSQGTITGSAGNVISGQIGANVTGVTQNSATCPLTLSGANLYTGSTTVSAGTLILGHANASSNSSGVTIADTGALSLTTTSSTVKALTFSANGKLNFNVAGGGTNLTVSNTNGVTNSGAAGSVTINITGSAPANGTYPLITYSGALQGSGFSAYTLGTTPPGKTYALNDAAGVVELVVSDLPAMKWTGLQSSEWSTAAIAGSKNWNQGASPVDYADGEPVTFDDTAANYTIDLSVADVTPSNVSFDNSGATPYTLQGSKAIAGTTALTKSGSQTLIITNSNTYTGDTIINAGKLEIGGAAVLGTAGAYAGAMTIATGATFEKSSSGTQTLSGAVTGGGTLKMSNGGTTLTNSGNGFGALEITGGRVFISTSASALPAAATTSVTSGGLLVFNTSGTYGQAITLGNNGGICSRNSSGATFNNVTLPGSGTVIFNNDDSATRLLTITKGQTLTGELTVQISGNRMLTTTTELGAVTMSGVISGSGGLTLSSSGNSGNASLYGTGTLNLTGANTFTGATTVKSGKLVLDGGTNRLASTGAVVLGDATTTGKLVLGGTSQVSQTLSALTTTGSGGSVVGGNASNSTLFLNIASSNTFDGAIGGSGTNENNLALTKQGAGTLTISNTANTFVGQVLSDAGTIQVSKLEDNGIASSLGAGTSSIRLGSNATATLEYIGTADSSTNKVIQIGTNTATNTGSAMILNNGNGKLTFTATTLNQVVAGVTVARSLTLGGNYTGSANEILGAIKDHNTAGGGIVSLTKEGAGTWALSGVNTYTGDTTVNSGVLALKGTSIADTGKLIIAGGTVDLTSAETVDKLFFGSTQQPAGIYSSTSVPAGATITTSSFSGTGTLIVTTGTGLTFSSWIAGTFANGQVDAGKQGPADDADGDGISNLMEFALEGMDPTVSNTLGASSNGTTLTYNKRQTPAVTGITYAIEESTDLGVADAWTEVSGNNYVNAATAITYTYTPGTPATNFYRLKVSQ